MTLINIPNLGTGATLSGPGIPPLAAFSIPSVLRANLQRAYFFGNGALPGANKMEDFSDNSYLAAKVGAPVWTPGAGYTCDQNNYFDLGLTDSADLSIAVILKRTSSAATGYFGNFNFVDTVTPVNGAGFYSSSSGASLAFVAGRSGMPLPSGPQASIAASLDSWGLYLGRASTGGATIIDNLTAGTTGQNTAVTGVARLTNTQNLRAGAVDGTVYDGAPAVAAAMVWNAVLDPTQKAAVTTTLRAYAATLGITV